MQPLTYGRTPSPGGFAPPTATLGYGSMAQYGQSPYAIGSVPAPTVTVPEVTVPDVTVPQVSVTTPDAGGGVASVLQGFGKDSMTDALRGVGLNAQNPMESFSWKGMLKDTFLGKEGGLNLDNIGTLVSSIGALGNLWSGFKQNKLASEALDFQKDAYNTNLSNQTKSYDLALEDRIRARYSQEGRSAADADAYIAKHKLGK